MRKRRCFHFLSQKKNGSWEHTHWIIVRSPRSSRFIRRWNRNTHTHTHHLRIFIPNNNIWLVRCVNCEACNLLQNDSLIVFLYLYFSFLFFLSVVFFFFFISSQSIFHFWIFGHITHYSGLCACFFMCPSNLSTKIENGKIKTWANCFKTKNFFFCFVTSIRSIRDFLGNFFFFCFLVIFFFHCLRSFLSFSNTNDSRYIHYVYTKHTYNLYSFHHILSSSIFGIRLLKLTRANRHNSIFPNHKLHWFCALRPHALNGILWSIIQINH